MSAALSSLQAPPDGVWDVVVVGAGAAGLMAAIWSGRSGRRTLVLDGARTLGAKILVAGGGRCNVTHHAVSERDYAGGSPAAIRKVLQRFSVERTCAFFADLGVVLKREDTGKLFPVSDDARTVLAALLHAAKDAGCVLAHPARVTGITRDDEGFTLTASASTPAESQVALRARRVTLATGGMSLPKSGSDGGGYALATSLGHTLTPRIFPALVPLLLPADHPLRTLSGIAAEMAVRLVGATGRHHHTVTGSVLLTHFGLSGPAILDISRHFTALRGVDPGASLLLGLLPAETPETVDADLLAHGRELPLPWLRGRLPERLARTVLSVAGVDPERPLRQLTRDERRTLARTLTAWPIHPAGDRGFTYAEVTAGGVPLTEVRLETMESRATPGLSLVGEVLDVDGRIGGFNFQWAWATGYIAGSAMGDAQADTIRRRG